MFSLQGSPPLPNLDFGLCARVSPAVFLSPRSHFPPGQRFPLSNHVTSGFMSPRSFFPLGPRFPLPKHVTSGCMSPRSLFTHWSAVSPSKPRDFHRPIRSQEICYLGPLYYCLVLNAFPNQHLDLRLSRTRESPIKHKL